MKIFANKSILKKIIIIFLLIFAISFTKPQPVHASVGGELMKPVCDLVVGLGDGVIKVIHIGMLGQYNTQLVIEEGGMGSFISFAIKVACIAVVVIGIVIAGSIILPIISGGISAILAGGAIATAEAIGTIVSVGGTLVKTTLIAGVIFFASSAFKNQVVLPLYSLSPEEIFRNKIPIFDVNFVNPDSSAINSEWANKIELDSLAYGNRLNDEAKTSNGEYRVRRDGETFPSVDEVKNKGTRLEGDDVKKYYNTSQGFSVVPSNQYGKAYVYVYKEGDNEYIVKSEPQVGYQYTDSVVMIKVTDTDIKTSDGDSEDNKIHGVAFLLQETISSWYQRIRIIAIVGMMSILVYIGIRITISSASEQKAKYKELLKDWLVGMILLFSMHYIMNFSNVAVNKLTDWFNTLNPTQMVPIIEDNINGNKGKVLSTLEQYDVPKNPENSGGRMLWDSAEDSEGNKYVEWHTNLMGAIRMKAEAGKESGTDESFIGYSIMFAVLVIYTLSFVWIYLKRVVYMAFLTLISPLVAMTYPIDKVNDGSAQGFNYWFKEYIFNLLIQPVHLLIYTLLVASAAEIAVKHWIYSLVVIGFLPQAEKILRKMFNFRAENTPGLMSGAIGTGLTMAGMRWLMGRGSNDKSNKGKSDEESQKNIGGTDKTKIRDLIGGGTSESDDSNSDETGGDTTTVKMNNNGDDDSYASETLDNLINGNKSATKKGTNNALTKGASNTISAAKGKGKSVKTQDNSSRKKNIKQGFRNMADRFVANQRYKAKNSKPLSTLGKSLGKGAAGAFGAATLGTIGLAAGIATGDASNAFQFAGAGIAGGYKLGSGTASSITNNIAEGLDIEGYKEAFGRGALGGEAYDIKQSEKYAKEYASRPEVIQHVMEKRHYDSWEEAEKETRDMAMQYGAVEGNYNVDDWMNYEKYIENYVKKNIKDPEERRQARKQAVAAQKTFDNFYDSKKERKDIEKAMRDSMGINNSQARILSNAMYNWSNIIN